MAEQVDIKGRLRRDGERSGLVPSGDRKADGPMGPGEPSATAVAGRSFGDMVGEVKALKGDLYFLRTAAKTIFHGVGEMRAIVAEIRAELADLLGQPPAAPPAEPPPAPFGARPLHLEMTGAKDTGILAQVRDAAADVLRYNSVPLLASEITDTLATQDAFSKDDKATIRGRLAAALRRNRNMFASSGKGRAARWQLK